MSGVSPYPRDVIIDADGIIRYIVADYDPHEMRRVIDTLLVGTPAALKSDNFENQSNSVTVFPNPFNARITIELTSGSVADITLKLFDIQGKAVYTERIASPGRGRWRHTLNTEFLASGLYFLQVRQPKLTISKKIILVR